MDGDRAKRRDRPCVGPEVAARLLTMPTAKGTQPTPSMKDEQKPYAERIREQYDTTNLAAIMGRFYNAVSGGSD